MTHNDWVLLIIILLFTALSLSRRAHTFDVHGLHWNSILLNMLLANSIFCISVQQIYVRLYLLHICWLQCALLFLRHDLANNSIHPQRDNRRQQALYFNYTKKYLKVANIISRNISDTFQTTEVQLYWNKYKCVIFFFLQKLKFYVKRLLIILI